MRINSPDDQNSYDFKGAYISTKHMLALDAHARMFFLPRAKRILQHQSGAHISLFKGRGMEFSEVRPYQAGDDVRSIDWKVTARKNRPHTKLFHEERERPVFILCDQSQSMFFGSRRCFKSVKAAQIAGLFAWAALHRNDRVGGIVFSNTGHNELKPARSRKTLLRFLDAISRYNNALSVETELSGSDDYWNLALRSAVRLAKPGSLIILISDFMNMDDESQRYLSRLSMHNELLFVQVYDRLDRELPGAGIYPLMYGDRLIAVDTRLAQGRSRYHQWFETRTQQVKNEAMRIKAPFIQVGTHEVLPDSLSQTLAKYSRN